MYIFIVLFILLDLLICLIYTLLLICLGLENWRQHSVSPVIGVTPPYIANFCGQGRAGGYLGLVLIVSFSPCGCLCVNGTFL